MKQKYVVTGPCVYTKCPLHTHKEEPKLVETIRASHSTTMIMIMLVLGVFENARNSPNMRRATTVVPPNSGKLHARMKPTEANVYACVCVLYLRIVASAQRSAHTHTHTVGHYVGAGPSVRACRRRLSSFYVVGGIVAALLPHQNCRLLHNNAANIVIVGLRTSVHALAYAYRTHNKQFAKSYSTHTHARAYRDIPFRATFNAISRQPSKRLV